MYQLITKSMFHNEFNQWESRRDTFSYEALNALYDYLTEFEENEVGHELDIIALCCDYNELSWEEVKQQYNFELDPDIDEHDELHDALNDATVIVWSNSERVLFQSF